MLPAAMLLAAAFPLRAQVSFELTVSLNGAELRPVSARGTAGILDAAAGRLLLSREAGPKISTIILSPDGRCIIASSRRTNNPIDCTIPGPGLGAVCILNAEGPSLRERIRSPDGRLLVFTDFLGANLELYRLP